MRAKLKIGSVIVHEECDAISFNAVCKDGGYDETGSDENNTFARFSHPYSAPPAGVFSNLCHAQLDHHHRR